jgi:hypothetical protein
MSLVRRRKDLRISVTTLYCGGSIFASTTHSKASKVSNPELNDLKAVTASLVLTWLTKLLSRHIGNQLCTCWHLRGHVRDVRNDANWPDGAANARSPYG